MSPHLSANSSPTAEPTQEQFHTPTPSFTLDPTASLIVQPDVPAGWSVVVWQNVAIPIPPDAQWEIVAQEASEAPLLARGMVSYPKRARMVERPFGPTFAVYQFPGSLDQWIATKTGGDAVQQTTLHDQVIAGRPAKTYQPVVTGACGRVISIFRLDEMRLIEIQSGCGEMERFTTILQRLTIETMDPAWVTGIPGRSAVLCVAYPDGSNVVRADLEAVNRAFIQYVKVHPDFVAAGLQASPPIPRAEASHRESGIDILVRNGCPRKAAFQQQTMEDMRVLQPGIAHTYVFITTEADLREQAFKHAFRTASQEYACIGDNCASVANGLYVLKSELQNEQQLGAALVFAIGLSNDVSISP